MGGISAESPPNPLLLMGSHPFSRGNRAETQVKKRGPPLFCFTCREGSPVFPRVFRDKSHPKITAPPQRFEPFVRYRCHGKIAETVWLHFLLLFFIVPTAQHTSGLLMVSEAFSSHEAVLVTEILGFPRGFPYAGLHTVRFVLGEGVKRSTEFCRKTQDFL